MHREFGIAVEAAESAARVCEETAWEQHPAIVRRFNDLGVAYREWHQFDLAAGYFEKAEAMANATVGQEHPDLPLVLSNFVHLRRAQGQRKMAKNWKTMQSELSAVKLASADAASSGKSAKARAAAVESVEGNSAATLYPPRRLVDSGKRASRRAIWS